jgi:hypothetical protein
LGRSGTSRPGRQTQPTAQIRTIDLTTDHRLWQKGTQGWRFPLSLPSVVQAKAGRDNFDKFRLISVAML